MSNPRSIVAVLAGLAVTLVLLWILTYLAHVLLATRPGAPPTSSELAVNLAGTAIAGLAGGATAVRLAPHTPHGHVLALAILILLTSLPTMLTPPTPGQPGWYGVVISVIGPIAAAIGGIFMDLKRSHLT